MQISKEYKSVVAQDCHINHYNLQICLLLPWNLTAITLWNQVSNKPDTLGVGRSIHRPPLAIVTSSFISLLTEQFLVKGYNPSNLRLCLSWQGRAVNKCANSPRKESHQLSEASNILLWRFFICDSLQAARRQVPVVIVKSKIRDLKRKRFFTLRDYCDEKQRMSLKRMPNILVTC